jgi:plasmid stabilization system protein ParE
MRVRQLAAATRDLEEALRHYAGADAELPQALLADVTVALQRIRAFPDAWRSIGIGFRRHSLRGFPYAVIYRFDGEEIIVVAYAHHRRTPGFWADRVQDAA